MCRLATYIGSSIPLEALLLRPDYGLMEQSWAPREMREGKLNADGYGFGWFNADGHPAAYRNPMPIWTDPNLQPLAHSLSATQWFANVRSATLSLDVSHANTQPFTDERFIFLHNGYLREFSQRVRRELRSTVNGAIEAGIHGTTDSEHLFALFRHIHAEDPASSIPDIFAKLCKITDKILDGASALMNIVIGDGTKVYCLRHAINGECPSLYFNLNDENFPGGQLVASEPLTTSDFWEPVPVHHIFVMDGANDPQIIPL